MSRSVVSSPDASSYVESRHVKSSSVKSCYQPICIYKSSGVVSIPTFRFFGGNVSHQNNGNLPAIAFTNALAVSVLAQGMHLPKRTGYAWVK